MGIRSSAPGAAEALGRLGVADEMVVRALVGRLEDEGRLARGSAAEALGRLGPLGPEQAARVRALLT